MTTVSKIDHDAALASAASTERDRIKAILALDESKGREATAQHLATGTDMSVADAKALLATTPKANPAAAHGRDAAMGLSFVDTGDAQKPVDASAAWDRIARATERPVCSVTRLAPKSGTRIEMSNLETMLAAARADLAQAEATLASSASAEDAASFSSQAYSAWRAADDAAKAEVGRLRRWITKLHLDIQREAKAKADRAQADLEADANAAADAAANVITEGLAEMHAAVRRVMTAIALSNAKVEAAQRGRRPDLPQIETAEIRARRGEKLERRVLTQRTYEAWSYPDDKRPIGEDQAAQVVARGGNEGSIRSESGSHPVILRKFREMTVLPELAATHIEPLAEVLHIPPQRAGGAAGWTPIKYAGTADILRQLDVLAEFAATPDRRRPQIEIICLGDAKTSVAA